MDLIIQAGADVNSKPYFFCYTILLIESAKRGWHQCAISLLTAGADMNATHRAGNDALTYACISESPPNTNHENISRIKCVKLLLQTGAHNIFSSFHWRDKTLRK